jgi:putative ABC transport system ATP-binding protein
MSDNEAVITLEDVSKTHGIGETAVHALRSVSLVVRRGDFLAIVGPSGSGKSSLMNILGCLDSPSSGRYLFSGEDVSRMTDDELARIRNQRIGFVFQQFQLLGKLSAWRNVELPLLYRRSFGRREKALRALAQVGLDHRVDHLPTQLSGGQQQRVAVARALITDPDLVLADEPTGNLDTTSTRDILEIFHGLHRAGRTIVLITHDPEIAAVAPRVVTIRDGVLSEEPPRRSPRARTRRVVDGGAPPPARPARRRRPSPPPAMCPVPAGLVVAPSPARGRAARPTPPPTDEVPQRGAPCRRRSR